MQEIWKDYPKNDRYLISNYGKIFDKKLKREIGYRNYAGYILTPIGRLHRVILETFIGPFPKDKPYTNHIDGNKLNNRLDNLEYTNHKLNAIHAHKIGLINQSKKIKVFEKQTNKFIGEFYSVSDAAFKLTGKRGNCSNIIKVLKGKINSCYGYTYEYSS